MSNMRFNKPILTESTHIYVDDTTDNEYIFDGRKLIKIKDGQKPMIGDKPDDDTIAKEDEERERKAAQEREEDGEEAESEEDRQTRLDKIRRFLDDKDLGNQISSESETKVSEEKKRKKAAEKREIEKSLKGVARNTHVMKELANDLRQFLAKEVGKSQRNTSWRKYNANYDNSGLIRPGYRYEKIGKVPVIQIYVDQSGSWSETEIELGKEILRSIQEFERNKQIKSEVYYFSNIVTTDAAAARRDGGTGAGKTGEFMQQLNETKPDNVIVITDDDFDGWGLVGDYTAPGGVWLVFREGRSQKLMNQLRGKRMNKYYDIDRV